MRADTAEHSASSDRPAKGDKTHNLAYRTPLPPFPLCQAPLFMLCLPLASWQFVRALCITLSTEILRIRNAFACLARILWATAAAAAATTATTKLTTLARRCLISYVVYPPKRGVVWGGREVRESTTNNFDFLAMVSIINEPQIHNITRRWTQSTYGWVRERVFRCVCMCKGVCVCMWEGVCVGVCGVPKSNTRVKAAKCRIKHARMNSKHSKLRDCTGIYKNIYRKILLCYKYIKILKYLLNLALSLECKANRKRKKTKTKLLLLRS